MPNNYDLISVAASDGSTDCNCAYTEYTDFFMRKDAATSFTTSISAAGAASVWSPYTFTLGTTSSTTDAILTVQGVANTDAKIEVKGVATTTILPLSVTSTTLTAGAAMLLTNSAATLPAITTSGNLLPSGDDTLDLGASGTEWANVYTDNLTVSGTTNLTALTLTGALVVQGNTTLGNAGGDTVTVTGTATFTPEAEFNGGINCDGTLTMEGNAISSTGAITTTGTVTGAGVTATGTVTAALGTLTNATVATAPSADTGVVRRTDVNIGTGTTLTNIIPKITVTGGYITAISTAAAADLTLHAVNHKTTQVASDTAPTGGNVDALTASDIRAVDRTGPVVSAPLQITKPSGTNYTYNNDTYTEDYFSVIESTQTPAASGPVGQIIFRKAT